MRPNILPIIGMAVLVAAGSAHAAPAVHELEGWGKYKWGMSLTEVKRLSGGTEMPRPQLTDPDTGQRLPTFSTHVVRNLVIDQIPMEADFEIGCGDVGLVRVYLGFHRSYFKRAEALLTAKYGKPRRDVLPIEWFGNFKKTSISLVLPNIDEWDMGIAFAATGGRERKPHACQEAMPAKSAPAPRR